MPLIKETVINWWNKTFSNVLNIKGVWFSTVTVYNFITVGGSVLLLVAAAVVFQLYRYKNTVKDRPPITDVCIYVPQPPNANPRRHRELRSEFDSIKTYIEETSPLKKSGLRFKLTDKHPNGSIRAKICVIYCDGIDHAEQSCLNMEKIQAEAVILIMKYGPKRTAQILIDGGIKIVRWFKVDTSAMNLLNVVKDCIVPLLEELGKRERNFKGSSFSFLSEYNGNGHFLHEDENNEHGTEIHGRSALKSKNVLFINLKKESPTKVEISLKKDRSIWGFDQHKLGKLRYHSSDPNALEEFKRVEESQRDREDDLVISVEPFDRCRALALYICMNIAEDDSSMFPGGVYRIAASGGPDRCTKEAFSSENEKVLASANRILVWIDESCKIFSSGQEFHDWKEKISAPSTFLITTTNYRGFAASQSFLDDLRQLRRNVEVLKAPMVMGVPPNIISSSHFEAYEGEIKFLPSEGCCAQRPSDDLVARVLKDKTAAFSHSLPEHIGVFQDDNGSWIVVVRISVASQLKHIFTSIYNRGAENIINKELTSQIDARRKERAERAAKVRLLKDALLVSVLFITMFFIPKKVINTIFFKYLPDDSFVNYHCVALASIYSLNTIVEKYHLTSQIDARRKEREAKVRLLKDALLVSVLFITMFFVPKKVINTMFFKYLPEDSFVNYHCVALASIYSLNTIVEKYHKKPQSAAVNTEDPLPGDDRVSSNITTNFFAINLQDAVTMYELGVLCIDTMTPEQTKIIEQASDSPRIHVAGVAGTGKTFIGMYFVLKFLREQEEGKKEAVKKKILYVCPTLTLGFYFANWLLSRMQLYDAKKENEILESIVFLVGVSDEHIYLMTVLDDSLDVKTKYRAEDFDFSTTNIGMVIMDEAHEKFAKKKTSFKLWNESGPPRSTGDFAGVQVSRALHGILTRRDESGKQCKAILLSDISQATTTEDRVVFPKNYKEFHLDEVTRCSKTIMLASKCFLPDNGRKTSCAHDTDGNMVISNLFDIPEGKDEAQLYKNKVKEEIERVRDLYKGMDLHMRLAIITPNEENSNGHDYLTELLEDVGLKRISAVDAMKCRRRRRKNKKPLKEEVMVDTISEVKGLEFLFVILVDMDRPVSDGNPKLNKETQSWFCSGISRSHCHVSVVNKNIHKGFLNWLHLTQAAKERGDQQSMADEDENINSKAITRMVRPESSLTPAPASLVRPESSLTPAPASLRVSSLQTVSSEDDTSIPSFEGIYSIASKLRHDYGTTESCVWNNVCSNNAESLLKEISFNPLQNDDLYKLCEQKEWENVRQDLRTSSASDNVKKRRLLWKGGDGTNCLHLAFRNGAPLEVVMAMVKIGGKDVVVATDNGGSTTLHYACKSGESLEVINAILDVGGREWVMIHNSGYTALHYLCMYTSYHDDCVGAARALLAKGGRELLQIKAGGKTALDLAKQFNAPSDLINLLSNS